MRILILDDDAARREALAATVARDVAGADVRRIAAADPAAADEAGAEVAVVVATGVDAGVLAAVRALRERRPDVRLLVASPCDGAAPAVAALHAGADDYVVLRSGGDGLGRALRPAGTPVPARRAGSRRAPDGGEPIRGLVGRSRAMERVRELVRTAARTEAHVLIEGETGTGKEVVARAVHALSRRTAGPFVPINCAAIPESLAESEFFGHARGAFTGAVQERPGVLQLADRGTLFLDEVEDLTPPLQAKLLRVVQDREVRPLGGSTIRRVDIRIVAASNRDLWRMVEAGGFRRDLYYRLRVLPIALPPLRQRRDDLPLLVEHFVERFNARHGTRFTPPSGVTLRPLVEHSWPGNVRELENTLESLLVLANASGDDPGRLLLDPGAVLGLVGDERTRILRVLDEHRWNRQRAAAALGISRVTLWRRMERHGIRDPLGAPARETG
jgi:DNA-binding NtrC family response regulator